MKATIRYEEACEAIGNEFREKYYTDSDSWCVADDMTDVWFFDNQFFTVDKMYDILKEELTKEELEVYYEHIELTPRAWRTLNDKNT